MRGDARTSVALEHDVIAERADLLDDCFGIVDGAVRPNFDTIILKAM
jgi:hypothetical protein